MAYSYNIYAGNGSTTQFTVGFPYIRKDHVVAFVNYTLTSAFTWVNDSTIQFTTAPGAGVRVEIRRYSPTSSRLVDYADGSTLVAADLDTDSTQHLYKEQELDDDIKQSVYVDPTTGLPTASGQRITNVLDPVAAQDAATKNYVDTTTVASAGDTMTGPLAMSTNKITGLGNPTNAQDAATKTYVDSTTVASAGDSMTGALAMGANKITGLGDPTSAQDAATKTYVDSTTWNNTDETIDSTEAWVSSDSVIGTTGATTNEMDVRHDTLVQTSTPAGSGWRVGKTWLQNDANKTLSVWNGTGWLGVASGGTFTTQNTVIYVDAATGSDTNDGHRIINPMKTIKAAVASASAGWTIKVAPGVYQESLPIDITVANLSIVGEAQRSCFIHPTVATETQIMFRCNSGTYIDGFTFAGLKASGTRGGHPIDNDATYGLPTSQGWVAGFYPGAIIRKSPYINNSTNFADSGIDNATFDPNNYSGTGGDLTSGPAGGGIIVDGSLPDVTSPLRSFVVNEFTQVCLDGPGLLVCNNGYAQAVSFFGLFCHYHAKALSGGQINMEVGTTDFGRYGLIADGKSTTPIFTATSNGSAAAAAVTFAINAPTTGSGWFGDANRPAINMLAEVTVSGTTYLYPILSSGVNSSGWNVTISRPNPSNRSENLGLNVTVPSGTQWRFYLRSMVSTASHTMEYAGSGTNYTALPENGGVALEANEVVNRNGGKVWLTSTDQSGKFKVGDTFAVDQQTGYVTIDPQSVAINVVSDLSPELGGDLDVLARNIYSSVGDIGIQDAFNTGVNLMLVRESSLATAYPVVTQYDIGTDPNQVPLNGLLGTMAFQDSDGVSIGTASINLGTAAAPSISFTGDSNTGIYSPGADQFAISTGGIQRATIDASGRLFLGTNTAQLLVGTSTSTNNTRLGEKLAVVSSGGSAGDNGGISLTNYAGSGDPGLAPILDFQRSRGTTDGSFAEVASGEALGYIVFRGADGAGWSDGAWIKSEADGDWTTSGDTTDSPGRLTFFTTPDGAASPAERLRITSDGQILAGTTSTAFSGRLVVSSDQATQSGIDSRSTNSAITTQNVLRVITGSNTVIGSITHNSLTTAFNTSSDYRLKENVVPLTGAIARVNNLQVRRFNFIADPTHTVDGFIAHEAQAIVPECVTGEKDAVDADDNPVYQGIDQSKLVPLLTAALQEAIAKIASLEARLTALEAN